MLYSVEYFHPRVLAEIQAWPVDVLADYARLVELLMEHGQNLRSGIGRAFYCFLLDRRVIVLHAFVKKSQQTPDRQLTLARKRLREVRNG